MCVLTIASQPSTNVAQVTAFGEPIRYSHFSSYKALQWADGGYILPTMKAKSAEASVLVGEVGILKDLPVVFYLHDSELKQLPNPHQYRVLSEEIPISQLSSLKEAVSKWIKTSVLALNWSEKKFNSSNFEFVTLVELAKRMSKSQKKLWYMVLLFIIILLIIIILLFFLLFFLLFLLLIIISYYYLR